MTSDIKDMAGHSTCQKLSAMLECVTSLDNTMRWLYELAWSFLLESIASTFPGTKVYTEIIICHSNTCTSTRSSEMRNVDFSVIATPHMYSQNE